MISIITSVLKKWLTNRGLKGFIQVAKAPAHPNVLEMAGKLNIDTLTNVMVHKKLGLSSTGECHFDIFPTENIGALFGREFTLG